MNQQRINAFEQGWESADTKAENPYLWSSESYDAFRLGNWWRWMGYRYPEGIAKSRGYTWKLDGHLVRSEAGKPLEVLTVEQPVQAGEMVAA